jgi:hypothetical protein
MSVSEHNLPPLADPTLDMPAGDAESSTPPPRTATVLALLAGVALVFSWLASYAAVNALLRADLIKPWAAGSDPRPRWLLEWFLALLTIFLAVGAAFRWVSRRQLRRIDAIADEEQKPHV